MPSAAVHGRALVLGVALTFVVTLMVAVASRGGGRMELFVGHGQPAAMTITATQPSEPGLIEIENRGDSSISFDIPNTWVRREVRGVELSRVKGTLLDEGPVRWYLPPGGTISFAVGLLPASLILTQESGIPLSVRTITVDPETRERTESTILLQTDRLRLW